MSSTELTVDFGALGVGESLILKTCEWEELRPVYEQCLAYVRTPEAGGAQFEFDCEKNGEKVRARRARWFVRRVR